MPTDTNTALYAALIGGCSAAIVSSAASVMNTWIIRRSEDRRYLREIAMKTAMEHWRESREMAKLVGEKFQQDINVPPLNVWIIHMLKVAEMVSKKNLTPENVGAELRKIKEITDAAVAETKTFKK